MLVSNSFTGNLRDTLGFESSYSYFNPIVLRKYAASLLSKDSLHWVGDSTVYPRRIFRFIRNCVPLISGRTRSL